MQEATLRLAKGLLIVSPWPVIYLEKERAIVASDLHLGFEDKLEQEGISIPRSFLGQILQSIIEPAKNMGASKIIFLGDVKHEFGEPEEAEWYFVKKMLRECFKVVKDVEVVKGNHDNYIARILKEFNIPLYTPSLEAGGYTLTHGHLDVKGKRLLIGHEHPAVSIKDDFGVKHRYKAFIEAEVHDKKVFVLPSASPITLGTDMNETPSSQLLSPILNGKRLDDAIPYLVDIGTAVKKFPPLKML
ncbi:MAG: metallophosphoesterase family protein [Conexivisphaerales archaeon]